MSETLTTSEAAEILGLTRQRVVALIRSGLLVAEKGRYGAYAVKREDLERFMALDRAPGKRQS